MNTFARNNRNGISNGLNTLFGMVAKALVVGAVVTFLAHVANACAVLGA